MVFVFDSKENYNHKVSNDVKELQDRIDHLAADNKKLGSYKMMCDEKLRIAVRIWKQI